MAHINRAALQHVRIGKIVGENEDGVTLFVPKDLGGTFTIEEGDAFLSLLFIRQDDGQIVTWLPEGFVEA